MVTIPHSRTFDLRHVAVPSRLARRRSDLVPYLTALRAYIPNHDRGFHGVKEVVAFLNDEIGMKNANGDRISEAVVYLWIKHRKFPAYVDRYHRGIFCTMFQILAWLWSHDCRRRS